MDENDFNLSENNSVPSSLELGPEGGAGNESGSDVLGLINEAANREYKSVDEAKKGLKQTFQYVGKVGQVEKKAQLVDAIVSALNLGDEKGVEQWIASVEKDKGETAPADTQAASSDVSAKLEKIELLQEHPEAKDYLSVIEKEAKATGISLSEAFKSEFVQDYIATKTSQKEIQPSVLETNKRVGFRADELKELLTNYQAHPSQENAEKLVAEVLNLK